VEFERLAVDEGLAELINVDKSLKAIDNASKEVNRASNEAIEASKEAGN
jgi:hypothetical protein